MKKWIKILIWVIATPVFMFGVLLLIYILMNRQGVIEPFQVGNPNAENRILLASQGSEFKNYLVENIIENNKDENSYFSIVDCTALEDENAANWDVVIIIHIMQIHKMPAKARKFLAEVKDLSSVMLVSTSGGGDDIVIDFEVDAISSASRAGNIPQILDWISTNLENRLLNESLVSTCN